jgi:hypothetical protein
VHQCALRTESVTEEAVINEGLTKDDLWLVLVLCSEETPDARKLVSAQSLDQSRVL